MWVLTLLLFVKVLLANTFILNNEPHSPCPDVFLYQTRKDFYQYGLLTVPSPPLNQSTVLLLASFVLQGRLPTRYGGLVELLRTPNETIDDIKRNIPIKFVIHFPVQASLPRLNYVLFNHRLICGKIDDDGFLVQYRMFHKIEFRYIFNTTDIRVDHKSEPNEPISQKDEVEQIQLPFRESFSEPKNIVETIDQNYRSTTATHPPIMCGVLHENFESSTRTPGGIYIERGSWPWLIAIYALKTTGPLFICAGTLVSPKIIITAASCLKTSNQILTANEILAVAGRHNMSNWLEADTQSMYIYSLHTHPNFQIESAVDDIALLILRTCLIINEFVIPACVFTDLAEPIQPNRLVGTIVGWNFESNSIQPILSSPVSTIISMMPGNNCSCKPESFGEMERSLCAGNRIESTQFVSCYGNLGSGFVTLTNNRLALRGIVTNGCESIKQTGVCGSTRTGFIKMTDVSKYSKWYNEIVSTNH